MKSHNHCHKCKDKATAYFNLKALCKKHYQEMKVLMKSNIVKKRNKRKLKRLNGIQNK